MFEQRFVILESDLPHSPSELIGGKAYHLSQIRSFARIPPSFVITTAALRSMLNDVDRNPDVDSLPAIRRLLETFELPECLVSQIRCAAAEWFAAGTQLVVRSSAVTEDGDRLSFAGIYDSVLGVTDESALIAAIRQVWLSALSPRAVAYRQQHGLEPFSIDMAVLVQAMIPTTAAGV